MGSLWIVRRGDQERGPFTSPQLRSLAKSGQLRRTDLVTKQGQNRYVPAEKVKGLFTPPTNQTTTLTPPTKPKAPAKPTFSDEDDLDFAVAEIVEDDDRPPVRSKTPAKPKPSDDEDLDFSVVEVIEDDAIVEIVEDDAVVEVIEDGSIVEVIEDDAVMVVGEVSDEFNLFDFDTRGANESKEPEPRRSSRSGSSRPAKGQSAPPPRRAAAPSKPAKPKKRAKENGEEDDEENSPWANLFYGVVCVLAGILLFIGMRNEDPNEWASRRGGAIVAVVKLLYNIGGEWLVLVMAILISLLFFGSAINQFRKGQS